MAHTRSLPDTDVLSALMKGDPSVSSAASDYVAAHGFLSFSLITRYEILRGLKAKEATAQMRAFDRLCSVCEIVPLTDEVVVRAADVYADLKRRGELIGDADILIGAFRSGRGFRDSHQEPGSLPADHGSRGAELGLGLRSHRSTSLDSSTYTAPSQRLTPVWCVVASAQSKPY
jgi:tRNA(fMet)-specific endonuclease VapC